MMMLKFIQVFNGSVSVWAKRLQLYNIARGVIVMQSTKFFFFSNISSLIDWFSVGRLKGIGYNEMFIEIPLYKLVTAGCDSLICVALETPCVLHEN